MDSRHNTHHRRSKGKQSSGGVPTSDDTKRTKHDAETTQVRYENHANTTKLHYWPRMALDPIQRLPSELAMLMIYEVLQADKLYSGRLIELTRVSRSWQDFLFSTPTLWSELNVDERQPDLLVTLTVFVHFSCGAPLKCVIWDHLIQHWPGIMAILLPVRQRITTLIVRRTSNRYSPSMTYPLLYVVSAFFDHLSRLPNIAEVILDGATEFDVVQLEGLKFSPSVKFTGKFKVGLPRIQPAKRKPLGFDMTKYINLGAIAIAVHPSLLLSFRLRSSDQEYKSIVLNTGVTLPYLKDITENLTQIGGLEHLIGFTASNLIHLCFEVSSSQIKDLVDCLRLVMNLQELHLDISAPEQPESRDLAPSDTVTQSLRTLRLRLLAPRIEWVASYIIHALFEEFKSLYPAVKHFSMRMGPRSGGGIRIRPFFASYLQNLRHLESLYLDLPDEEKTEKWDPIVLWSLTELTVSSASAFKFLQAPNVLRLELLRLYSWEGLHGLSFQHLRTLVVPSARLNKLLGWIALDFSRLDCPRLLQLSLTISTRLESWKHVSLLQLVSLSLKSSPCFTNPQGNFLCRTILYHPDHVPSLQELRFNLCVEWDILFLMLERRNFGTKGVTRIHTVDLPFIPSDLRHALTLLLAGNIPERPSLIDLSLEATRELLFDNTVRGCFYCLKNMVPSCGEAVDRRHFGERNPDRLYSQFEPPPDEAPTQIRDWIHQRNGLVDVWKVSFREFADEYYRKDICWRFSGAMPE